MNFSDGSSSTKKDDGSQVWVSEKPWTGRTVFLLGDPELAVMSRNQTQEPEELGTQGGSPRKSSLQVAEALRQLTGASIPKLPTLPAQKKGYALLKQLRSDVDALETAFMASDLTAAAQSVAEVSLSSGLAVTEFGLQGVHDELMSEVHRSNLTLTLESEEDAIEAARQMPSGARVTIVEFEGKRRWSILSEEGKAMKPPGWKAPRLRPIVEAAVKQQRSRLQQEPNAPERHWFEVLDDWKRDGGRQSMGCRWTGTTYFEREDGSWREVVHSKHRSALATPSGIESGER
jgi:hypothetical protein